MSTAEQPDWYRSPAPYEAGNVASLRHGAYSPRVIADQAAIVHEHLLEVAPWCDEPRYLPSVQRYIDATAREQLAHQALMASPKLSPRLLEAATAAARLAWAMGDALGLTPAGHAKLKMVTAGGVNAEASLADLVADGRLTRAMAEWSSEPASGGETATQQPESERD